MPCGFSSKNSKLKQNLKNSSMNSRRMEKDSFASDVFYFEWPGVMSKCVANLIFLKPLKYTGVP